MKRWGRSLLDFLYPPLCLHCDSSLLQEERLLCSPCQGMMEVLQPAGRCPLCFSQDFDERHVLCHDCVKKPSAISNTLSVFDYMGPAAAMVKRLKYANQHFLAGGMAAYMAAQLLESGWEVPDYLVPVPISWLRQFDRGYNQSALLAEGMAQLLGCKVARTVGRRCGEMSQAGLSRRQREAMGEELFFLRRGAEELRERSVVIVDDVLTTGTTLRRCAEALAAQYPASIRAITFCRAF